MHRFSPTPGFRFDVELRQIDQSSLVRFSQPERRSPYLQGDLIWTISDEEAGPVFDEQLNTEKALSAGAQPFGGSRWSLRRWLFFRMGHKQVMTGATRNIATLIDLRLT